MATAWATQVFVDARRVPENGLKLRSLFFTLWCYAAVAELVDALASGASVSNDVEVQVLSAAPQTLLDSDKGE